ncbi:Ig-like domain-containing protein [Actinoplanes sp. NPDC049548]|uniref:Ig-like domain-containing protein n=1 Tax=Actinoplanes sp. NPDC049548 TaxID=3155152 RepID=UPI00343C834D
MFQGPFAVTGSADTLAFDLTLPAVSGNRTTSVVATVGSATIDTTLALTDNAPATSTVNVNTFPVAADDTVTVGDNRTSTVSVLGNDTDPDGDPLTVTGAGQGTNGTVALVGGVLSYTPATSFTGSDSFTYTVSDGRGGTDPATVNLTVTTPSGTPAQTTDDTATAVAGTPTTMDVLSNDTGQGLSVTGVSAPGNGTATITLGGTGVEYTGNSSFTGSDTFTYTVTDLGGNTSTGTVTVTVTAPVVPPVITPPALLIVADDEVDTPSGTVVVVSPLTNDTGDGPLSVQSAAGASHGTLTLTGDDVSYQPAADFWGTDTFTYTAQDAHAATATGTVTVTVLPSAAPAADTATVEFRTATLLGVLANDPAGATVAAVTPASHGTVTLDGGTVRYVPDSTYAGPDSFTYRLTGGPSVATVSVIVTGPALAPADDVLTAVRGAAGRIDVLGNDIGTGLTVEQVSAATHGTAELRGDGVWYTSGTAFRGTDTFTYRVRDAAGQTATAAVHVSVANAGPAIEAVPSRTVTAGESLVVPFRVTDSNDDDLTLTAGVPTGSEGAATGIRRTVTGTRLTLTVDERFSGVVTIPVEVRDQEASAATELTVTVLPAPAGTATGVILADPGARAELADPVYVDGRPTSRTLSNRVDSLVTWRPSPAANLIGYRVMLNGNRVCTVRATVRSCRIGSVALDPGDAVRVVAVGAEGTLAEPVAARITPTSAANRLLAVVYFPVSEFSLDAAARRVLGTVALQARTYGFGTALMVGHTDADGTAASNATLSQRRAAQVAAYFRRTYPGLRATHTGRGETQPVRPNTTGRNKAVNRRVEIYIG